MNGKIPTNNMMPLNSHLSLQIYEPESPREIQLVHRWDSLEPGTALFDQQGEQIIILKSGRINRHEGPDIKDAVIYSRGQFIAGDIECHLRSRSWFEHGHENDPNYRRVILHVVLIDDRPLKGISTVIFDKGIEVENRRCDLASSKNITKRYVESLAKKRWLNHVTQYINAHDRGLNLWKYLLSCSYKILGAGGNEESFRLLALEIIPEEMIQLTPAESLQIITEKSRKYTWHKRSIRPAHHPENRFSVAIELVHFLEKLINCNTGDQSIYNHLLASTQTWKSRHSIGVELEGNVFLPFLEAMSIQDHHYRGTTDYFHRWQSLKLSCSYQKYSRRFSLSFSPKDLRNFSFLQGLIELDNRFCNPARCILCPFGRK